MPVFQDSIVTGDNSNARAILARVHPFSLSSASLACTSSSAIICNNTIHRRLLSIGFIHKLSTIFSKISPKTIDKGIQSMLL